MTATEAYNYISQHQDSSMSDIAKGLGEPIEIANSLVIKWAIGYNYFVKAYTLMYPDQR